MPKLKFALERDSEKRVQVEYRGFYSDLSVRLDGQELGKFANRKELKAGRDFPLPDGSTLNVQLAPQATGAQLEVRRNGEALPGSAGDPEVRVKIAYGIIYFIAGLNLVLGLLGSFVTSELLQRLNAGPALIIEGLVYCALGLWFHLRASRIALVAAWCCLRSTARSSSLARDSRV